MAVYRISVVSIDMLPIYWRSIKPLLEKVLNDPKLGRDEMTIDDTYEFLQKNILKAVIIEQGFDIVACATIEILARPKNKVLLVHTIGGEKMKEWVIQLSDFCAGIGREIGAKYLQVNGRRGWKRFFPNCIERSVTYELEI